MEMMKAERKIKIFKAGTGYIHIKKAELNRLGLERGDWVEVIIRPVERKGRESVFLEETLNTTKAI